MNFPDTEDFEYLALRHNSMKPNAKARWKWVGLLPIGRVTFSLKSTPHSVPVRDEPYTAAEIRELLE